MDIIEGVDNKELLKLLKEGKGIDNQATNVLIGLLEKEMFKKEMFNDIRTIDDVCNSCLVLNECTHKYALFCKRIIRFLRMNGRLASRGERRKQFCPLCGNHFNKHIKIGREIVCPK